MADEDCERDAELTFEQAHERLEAVVRQLEDGQIGLTETLARYEQGVRLLRRCHQLLEAAQQKIELLSSVDASGQPVTEPFDQRDSLTIAQGGAQEGDQPANRRRSAPRRTASRPESAPEPPCGPNRGKPDGGGPDRGAPNMDEPGSLF